MDAPLYNAEILRLAASIPHGERLEAPCLPGFDTLRTLKRILSTGYEHSWFVLTQSIIANHVISTDPADYPAGLSQYGQQLAGRSMLVKKTQPLAIECIVRGYISGSFWSAYKKNPLVCGFHLPQGMQESDKFLEPLFTPSTKALLGDHDENISLARMQQIVGIDRAEEIASICLKLYKKAADFALAKGIIIADTKFELGELDGRLILIDEVLTPDSSRFWPVDHYQRGQSQPSFDKQFLRDYLATLSWDKTPPPPPLPKEITDKTRLRYQEAVQRITGKE